MERSQATPGEYGRVLRFERPGRSVPAARSPVPDVGQYAQAANEPDDYRHRQLVNLAALAVCVLLVAVGVWLADTIAQLRRDQDCVLAGRRNCAQITIVNPVGGAAVSAIREPGTLPHN